MTHTKWAGGPLDPQVKDHVQLLEELLVEVRQVAVKVNAAVASIEVLSNKIEEMLNDNPTDERHIVNLP